MLVRALRAYVNLHLGDQPARGIYVVHRPGASGGRFRTLDEEVLAKEALVLLVLMEALGGEHRRDDRHLGFDLHPHEAVDHGVGHELVAVDAAVDYEAGRDDRVVAARSGQQLRLQRYLKGAGYLDEVDRRRAPAETAKLGHEGEPALIDDVLVPAGLHERDAARPCGGLPVACGRREEVCLVCLIHGCPRTLAPESGRHGLACADGRAQPPARRVVPFSFIRTVTVGLGFTPSLLTPPRGFRRALAGSCDLSQLPPVGTSTPP